MRISDWSSDVCSSDLNETRALETLLLASGYRKNDFQIMAYNGAGNINAALGLATALKARHPQVEILIHRDRDYLSDEKAKAIEADIRKVGAQDRKSTRLNSSH